MIEINLHTKDCIFVASVFVTQFLPGQEPDVILWGNRCFIRRGDGLYREGFAVTALSYQ